MDISVSETKAFMKILVLIYIYFLRWIGTMINSCFEKLSLIGMG